MLHQTSKKALQKLVFAALGRHPSLLKVNFSMKTIKIHRENEGPAHEARIFTYIDLRFCCHFCKSIVFYCEMDVFLYRIFAMLLRHA